MYLECSPSCYVSRSEDLHLLDRHFNTYPVFQRTGGRPQSLSQFFRHEIIPLQLY